MNLRNLRNLRIVCSGRNEAATTTMAMITINDLSVREIFPGIRARLVHSAQTTQSWVELDSGATFPEHHHPHEQTVNVLEGTLELVVDGATFVLSAGQSYVIPSHAPHAGRARTACRVLDVFAPVREDYR
jgi:quercetin dioxygenase-like cupin family protein